MDGRKLFKQTIKLSFTMAGHNKNPSPIYCLDTFFIILISSVEKNFANSIGNNLFPLYKLLLNLHMERHIWLPLQPPLSNCKYFIKFEIVISLYKF